MCSTWQYPSNPKDEWDPNILEKLPSLSFANITGGEPLLREDLVEIADILMKKSKRVVISTNGFFTDKIINIAKKHKHIGIRISLEGLPSLNDELRGIKDGFDHGLRTLLELQRIGLKDIGFGITVSDKNAKDLVVLYRLAKKLNIEFATACVHNSFYFHKHDNKIEKKDEVIAYFYELINELLKTKKIKNWYRAYFNYGLINYIKGKNRLLPCMAGTNLFFLDPWGEIRSCNGMDSDALDNSMGNLKDKTFKEIWHETKAENIRKSVKNCTKNCWMIGTAGPAMKSNLIAPTLWILKNKIQYALGKTWNAE
jgi:radical SAM protein with 4Fe4S-binding SPASM domain